MIIVKNRELLIPGNERYIGTTYDTEVENRLFCLDRFNQSGFDLSNLTFRLDMKYPSTRKVYTFNATTSRTGRSVVILTKPYVAAYPYAGTVTFTFNGTAWSDGSQTVDLEDIGVSIAFTPNNGDTITVISTINNVNSDTVLLTKEISPNHIYLTWEITESQTAVAGTVFVSLRGFNEDVEQRYASFPGVFYVEKNINSPDGYPGNLSELEQLEAAIADALKHAENMNAVSEDVIDDANAFALLSEAYAKGTRNDIPVSSGQTGYKDNSKYWSQQSDINGQRWATGEVDGTPAPSTDETYHNNSKYWSEISHQYANTVSYKKVYTNVAEMVADTELIDGQVVRTLGYYAVNDGGGALYRIYSTATETHYETLTNGLYAMLIMGETVTTEQFGAYGDGTHDDAIAVQTALNSNKLVVFAQTYRIADDVEIKSDVIGINGSKILIGKNITIKTDNVIIDNVTFDGGWDCGTIKVQADNVQFLNCKFLNFGELNTNDKCVVLNIGESNLKHYSGIIVRGCYFDGITPLGASHGARQILIDRADCLVEGCYFINLHDYNDGDNIFVYAAHTESNLEYPFSQAGYQSLFSDVKIINNTFVLSNKSAIKNQASGTIIDGNTIIINSSDNDSMHSAIRAMCSENVIITNNCINHVAGNISNIITTEYTKYCSISGNKIISEDSGISHLLRCISNVLLSISGNAFDIKSLAAFFYGGNNDGIVFDNIYDCKHISASGFVYVFQEDYGSTATINYDFKLSIKNNVFRCSGSLQQFVLYFKNSVNISLEDNTIDGTFTHNYACADYRFHHVNENYDLITIRNEKTVTPISVNISKSGDVRTNLFKCTIKNTAVSNINIYNSTKIKFTGCKLQRADSSPINFYSSPTTIVEDCDLTALPYRGRLATIRITNITPIIILSGCEFGDYLADQMIALPTGVTYSLSNVKWRRNNLSSIANIDYTSDISNIIAFTFDTGAQCYDTALNKMRVYYNNSWS